jgi:O-succinylbenzoic acid--CoA ligase
MSGLRLFEQASQTPDALALIADGARWSYAELAREVRRVAARLDAAGLLTPETRPLAVTLRPNRGGLCVLHACIAYGVPILVMDPRLPVAERATLAARAEARATLDADELEPSSSLAPEPSNHAAFDPAAPLAIVPTSGSTGRTKLVVLSRQAFAAAAAASNANLPLAAGDRWLLCLPLSHVGGLSIATRCLISGVTVVAFEPRPAGLLASVGELAELMARESATLISVVPTVLEALLDLSPPWTPAASLRALLVGGAGMPVPLLRRAEARRLPLLTTYGLTEACSQVATTPWGTFPRVAGSTVSAGRPLAGFELAFDPDQRLKIRGPTRCSHYIGEPLPLDADGFLRTEDRGYLDAQGELFVLGRHGDLIVSGGENVDPRRVEAILTGAPGVRAVHVFGAQDPSFGEVVACAVIPEPDFSPDAVAGYLREHLAPHERPRRLARLTAFPSLLNGKLNLQALQALALAALVPWPTSKDRT